MRMWIRALVALVALSSLTGCSEFMVQRSPGEKLYRKECSSCHGIDGGGHTVRYMGNQWANLLDDAWKYGGDRQTIEATLEEGVVWEHPSYEELSREELRAVANWVLELRGESAP